MIRSRTLPFAIMLVVASACGGVKPYEPSAGERSTFLPSVRRNAPDLVYARTRWVRPPDVLPARERGSGDSDDRLRSSPMMRSVFQLSLKNSTLEETARVLAATARYSSFTAPSIASNPISIENLGTIDELARIIESKANIRVLVDHVNRVVRFMPGQMTSARTDSE